MTMNGYKFATNNDLRYNLPPTHGVCVYQNNKHSFQNEVERCGGGGLIVGVPCVVCKEVSLHGLHVFHELNEV